MRVVKTIPDLRGARATLGQSVGVVLTMGALHDGHLALVRAARADHEHVLATIFVNPAQFTPGEDFARYPRRIERDLDLLRDAGVDLVFTPSEEIMYPPGFQSHVMVGRVTEGLEGAARRGHFMGVATIVAKLFNLTQPATTYFGQKDAQQVAVVRRMVRDLNFPLEIAVIPTVREPDGLAMSSRNVYLTPEQRQKAPAIWCALNAAGDAYEAGERDPAALRASALAVLDGCGGEIEYVSMNDPRTLAAVDQVTESPLLLSMVVRYGNTRLLDNALLPASLNTREGLSATLGGE